MKKKVRLSPADESEKETEGPVILRLRKNGRQWRNTNGIIGRDQPKSHLASGVMLPQYVRKADAMTQLAMRTSLVA